MTVVEFSTAGYLFESLTRLGTIWIIDCCSCEPRKLDTRKYMAGWWFGTFYINFHILGMSSSHWTNSIFQRGRAKNHQPVSVSHTLSCKSCRSITWFSSVPRLCSSLEDLGRPEKPHFSQSSPLGWKRTNNVCEKTERTQINVPPVSKAATCLF